jgi:hypothetical protein
VVGGYAVSFHAQPRPTKDLDILIKADVANAEADSLIAAKLASGRPEDLADVAALRRAARSLTEPKLQSLWFCNKGNYATGR